MYICKIYVYVVYMGKLLRVNNIQKMFFPHSKNHYDDMMLTLNSLFYPAHNVNIPQNIMAYALNLYNFDEQLNKNLID